eukprot:CAMPEP_0168365082 /NCGR_PEP_ID=MMETSP0228-20121227/4536_1 /TAXON_ID=133427 /ORGANISM="Protoceratium reticulatum, Strain CCCM 535 (=CCMP 1889)" /LENGTH=37 /DNA_ID= /DNA_START= /DNA_END= /DNA_ORIENTATION=
MTPWAQEYSLGPSFSSITTARDSMSAMAAARRIDQFQ